MTLYCSSCGVRTAGAVIDVKSECRWCPICGQALFQYAGCERERLEKCGGLCETCRSINVAKEAKPAVDQKSIPTRGPTWGNGSS